MQNTYRVLVIASNSSMNSGASRSLVTFVSIIQKQRKDFSLEVLIPMHDDINEFLKEEKIKYKVLLYSNKLWRKSIDSKCGLISKLLREIVVFVADLKLNILSKRFDLIHINALTTNMGAEAAYKNRKKVLWHFREFMEEDLGEEFVCKKEALQLIDKADARIAISESVAEKYRSILNNEIKVIYNGIDHNRYYLKRDILRDEFVRVFLPGRITSQKGQMLLLKALKTLKDQGRSDIFVTIIGSGDKEYIDLLKGYVEENELPVNIIEPRNNIIELYQKHDVVCVCSYCEAFGRVTVEGMMTGNVVLGSNSGATAELIENEETGFLYERDNVLSLAQKLEYIATHRDIARKIALKGQQKAVENFTAEKNAEQIYKLYQSVLGV